MTANPKTGTFQDPAATTTAEAEADLYHDHDSALNWALRLEAFAWVPLVLGVLAFALWVTEMVTYLPQAARIGGLETYLSLSLPLIIPLTAAVVAGTLFVLLRAASQALLLLLDIQEKPTA